MMGMGNNDDDDDYGDYYDNYDDDDDAPIYGWPHSIGLPICLAEIGIHGNILANDDDAKEDGNFIIILMEMLILHILATMAMKKFESLYTYIYTVQCTPIAVSSCRCCLSREKKVADCQFGSGLDISWFVVIFWEVENIPQKVCITIHLYIQFANLGQVWIFLYTVQCVQCTPIAVSSCWCCLPRGKKLPIANLGQVNLFVPPPQTTICKLF